MTGDRKRLAFVMAAVLAGAVAAGSAAAKEPKPRTVPIPFEVERAKQRGDRYALKLMDDATIIPGHRVQELPIVDGRMGEHVRLDGVELYFPYGRILSAKSDFLPGSPEYRHVATFDSALGPVCAKAPNGGANGGAVEMRINRDKAISVVQELPLDAAKAGNATGKGYQVTTALEIRFLRAEPAADTLYSQCLNGGKSPAKVVTK